MNAVIDMMNEHDIEPVARLRMAAFFGGAVRTLGHDVAGLHRLLTGDDRLEVAFVARVDGMPAGTVLLVRHELDAAHDVTPWLAGLVVGPAFRGRGIGAALVKAVEAHGRAQGVEVLHLYTWEARRFYASLGWRSVETFEEHGEPMMLMSRRLPL
ncbi:MAG: GNAT family N-acetyltransferase [Mesorhizobium sp.]|nr:GNAT family N-acetyltransferase [Mesorhizobium sp.]MBN9242311.1 GNAT family N-acetyltransferase [Mesorhizobium sp.]MBN9271992.1 GNAT family N-acetyltransferase [Mesorhizobium sp.]